MGSCNQPYVELRAQHKKNPGINSYDIITVRVLIICVDFSTCSVVVGGGGGETLGSMGYLRCWPIQHELVLFYC